MTWAEEAKLSNPVDNDMEVKEGAVSAITSVLVSIEYRTTGSTEWRSITLAPQEYFDLDEDEAISWDCVPLYNHAIDYLKVEKPTVRNTRLTIVDAKFKITKQITETFWNSGKNRVVERIDTGPEIDYWELIVELMVSETPVTWEILRLDRLEGVVVPNYHGIIQRKDDGSEIETRVRESTHEF